MKTTAARGWEVVEVFCDNDASADGRKPRRAYEWMLVAVEPDNIDAIVTWHHDRLHRSPKELEAFIDVGLGPVADDHAVVAQRLPIACATSWEVGSSSATRSSSLGPHLVVRLSA